MRLFKLSLIVFIFMSSTSDAGLTFRRFGDFARFANPIITAGFAVHEKGIGHFAIVFAQPNVPTWLMHYRGSRLKWSLSLRPRKLDQNGFEKEKNYTGLPSGHTVAAWSAPAYMHHFSKNYKWVSIPLYISATITACSRIRARAHTPFQVLASIALVEGLTYLNSKLSWSRNYCSSEFSIGGDGFFRLSLRF